VPVTIRDAMPMALELQTEIPADADPGLALQFIVTSDVVVDGQVVIAKGATAMGVVYAHDKGRRILGIGGGTKVSIQMKSVNAADGTTLNVRATAGAGADSNRTIESPGLKSETLAVAKGATTIAYLSGEQTVRIKK
jgi:hypothetical protein